MHMADALVNPAVAGTMYACSTIAAGYAIKKIKLEDESKKIPVMGVMGAFVFAGQMINFAIPGTGSSGHLCGGLMLSAILGPYAGFITMIGVLLIQCLVFADGGILALGCNIWNMAFYGCFVGAMLVWKYTMKRGMSKRKIVFASVLGCMLTLQLGAFSVTLETLASGITKLPFSVFVATMQPIHLAIGLVEGVITATVLCFIYEARPELLWNGSNPEQAMKEIDVAEGTNHLSIRQVLAIFVVAFVLIGGGLSLFASSHPDGLEWAIGRITGGEKWIHSDKFHQTAEQIQKITALLPDYAFSHNDSVAGTSVSGIVGGLLVIGLCLLVCYGIRYIRRHRHS